MNTEIPLIRFKTVSVVHLTMDELRALLIQRRLQTEPDLLSEFRALATTAGYTVVGQFDVIQPPSTAFGIGRGKVEEIGAWIESNHIDVVLFTPSLNSSQMYRLIKKWRVEVRDRIQVILEIFDIHAGTPEAKLQIEEARLRYELPFIRHQLRVRLQQEHTGARPVGRQIGAGEDILSLRMQEVRRRIAIIRAKLDEYSKSQALKRRKRIDRGFLEVALAGYTNAGKSSLHDALTESCAVASESLFTTLATKSTRLPMRGRRVVLTDSVGFINDLPQSLLDAFHTTLMEIGNADAILLVIDGSDSIEEINRKVTACFDTFRRIEINDRPMVAALNKVDLIDPIEIELRVEIIRKSVKTVIPVSAVKRTNLDRLLEALKDVLPQTDRYKIRLSYSDNSLSLLSWIHRVGHDVAEEYLEDSIEVTAGLTHSTADRLIKTLPVGAVTRDDTPLDGS